MIRRTLLVSMLSTVPAFSAFADNVQAGPPADAPRPAPEARPAERTFSATKNADQPFVFDFQCRPGIPNPNEVVELIVSVYEGKGPGRARIGQTVATQGASLVLELADPQGEIVGRYRGHPVPLTAGRYGFHLTPKQTGIYTITLRGETSDERALLATAKLPVNVWPLPDDLKSSTQDEAVLRRPIKN